MLAKVFLLRWLYFDSLEETIRYIVTSMSLPVLCDLMVNSLSKKLSVSHTILYSVARKVLAKTV